MIVFVFPAKPFRVYIWFTGGKHWSWEFGYSTFCFRRSANSVSTYIIHYLCCFTGTSFTSYYMTGYSFLFSLCLVVYIPFISLEILDWEFGKLLPDYLTKWKMFLSYACQCVLLQSTMLSFLVKYAFVLITFQSLFCRWMHLCTLWMLML